MSAAAPGPLAVYLHGELAGRLERLPEARFRFTYADDWIERGEAPLSISLPVGAERPTFEDAECAPFFAGLLPEGDFLRAVARAFHVSADNPFALLAEIGGECAGAIAIGAVDGPLPGSSAPPPKWLDADELGELLGELPERPLALLDFADEEDGIRISLAGAHDKAGVLCDGEEIGLTLGDPASTHILKLPIARVSEPIANEAYCMTLAAKSGLDAAAVEPRSIGGHEFLLVRRYDRDPDAQPDSRLHQEDFCQALGIRPGEKYEGEGGPGVAACAGLLRRASSAPARDLTTFLDALFFNFLIGNHDAHGKNYALLLDGPGAIRVAPLYDLLSTAVFEGTRRKLAMKYGGENRPEYLRRRHLDRLAEELGVRVPLVIRWAELTVEAVLRGREAARASLPPAFRDQPVLDRIDAVIDARCERLTRAVGEPLGS